MHSATGSPLAREALDRIGALFEIEEDLRGKIPNERSRARQEKAKPLVDVQAEWFDELLTKLSGKSLGQRNPLCPDPLGGTHMLY